MFKLMVILCTGAMLGGCSLSQQQKAVDLNAAYDVAAAVVAGYAKQPGADPKKVAQSAELLAAAQAAILTYSNTTAPADQSAASIAIAALVAYEAAMPARTAP
jgi:hypothetical protein